MEKEEGMQLELFGQTQEQSRAAATPQRVAMLAKLWRHEKVILGIIGMAVIGIVSFSLGVEKGKTEAGGSFTAASAQSSAPNLRESFPAPIQTVPTQKNIAVNEKEPVTVKPQVQDAPEKGYVIQLASYTQKAMAQQEISVLKKKGFSPFLLTKGSYTVLYVGSIQNKDKAQSLLTELKKRFKDCYIRRL